MSSLEVRWFLSEMDREEGRESVSGGQTVHICFLTVISLFLSNWESKLPRRDENRVSKLLGRFSLLSSFF